jgi:hypothetical protein
VCAVSSCTCPKIAVQIPPSSRVPITGVKPASRFAATVGMTHSCSCKFKSTCYALASAAVVLGTLGLLRVFKGPKALLRSRSATIRIHDGCLKCKDTQISVFSMNVLAPNLVSKLRYKHVPAVHLSWQYRFTRLKELLKEVWINTA